MLTRDWAVGTAVELLSLAQRGSQHSRRDAAPLAAGCAFSANWWFPRATIAAVRVYLRSPVNSGIPLVVTPCGHDRPRSQTTMTLAAGTRLGPYEMADP